MTKNSPLQRENNKDCIIGVKKKHIFADNARCPSAFYFAPPAVASTKKRHKRNRIRITKGEAPAIKELHGFSRKKPWPPERSRFKKITDIFLLHGITQRENRINIEIIETVIALEKRNNAGT